MGINLAVSHCFIFTGLVTVVTFIAIVTQLGEGYISAVMAQTYTTMFLNYVVTPKWLYATTLLSCFLISLKISHYYEGKIARLETDSIMNLHVAMCIAEAKRMPIPRKYIGAASFTQLKEIAVDIEHAYTVINLLRMIIMTYNETVPDTVPNKWYFVTRKHRLMTLINSVFHITTGQFLLRSFIDGDFNIFNGVEHVASLWAKKLFDDDFEDFSERSRSTRSTWPIESELVYQPWHDDAINELSKNRSNSFDSLSSEGKSMFAFSYEGAGLVEGIQMVNDMSGDYLEVLNSEFGKRITTLCSLLICVPALNSIGFTPSKVGLSDTLEKALRYDYAKASFISLPATIIEHSTWVMLKMSQMLMISKAHGPTAGMHALFVTRADMRDLHSEFLWLKVNSSAFAYCSQVVDPLTQKPAPFTLEGYGQRCNAAIEMADKILPSLKSDQYARNRIESMKFQLYSFYHDCSAELRLNDSRPHPYAICLTGPPSVGKTQIKNILINQMHMSDNISGRFEIKYNPKLVYTYNSDDDFYSGFNTSHTAILMDDMADKIPDIMKQNAGGDIAHVIKILNSVPFCPNQAELEKKGKTPMRIRYFVGTTNTPDLSAQHVYRCTAAVYRRMVFVSCSVKKEFRKRNSTALQGDSINPNNLDLWDFTVKKFEPQGDTCLKSYWNGSQFVQDEVNLDVTDLCKFINTNIGEHWAQQERANAANDHHLEADCCIHNISSAICRDCAYVPMKGESDGPSNVLQRFCGSMLLVPIYCLFTISVLHHRIWPKDFISRPVWSLRAARYLTGYMPYDHNRDLKYFRYIPSYFHNYLCQNYWYDRYDKARNRAFGDIKDLYEWFSTEVMHDWRFPLILGFLFAFKVARMAFKTSATGEADIMPEPDVLEKKRRNYWNKTNFIGQYPAVCSTVTKETLQNKTMLANIGIRVTLSNGQIFKTNATHLKGNVIITVAHPVLQYDDVEITSMELNFLQSSGQLAKIVVDIDPSCYFIDHKNDLLILKHNKIPLARGIIGYLRESSKEPVNVNCSGEVFYRIKDHGYEDERIKIHRVTNRKSCMPYVFEGSSYDAQGCLHANYEKSSFPGLCGAPVLGYQASRYLLLGIHCAGDHHNGTNGSFIRSLYQDQVNNYLEILKCTKFSANTSDIAYVGNADALKIVEVHPKSPILELAHEEVIILGDNVLPRAKPRTMVSRSPIWEPVLNHFRSFGFKRILHTSPKHCCPKKATLLAMEKAVTNAAFFPSEIDFCVEAITKEFLAKIPQSRLDRIKPYPWSVAINGRDGIPYVDRINTSTSGGYGHTGPKKKLLTLIDSTSEHQLCFEPTVELQTEIDWIMRQYSNYKVANPVFKCSFKDEPITFEKEAKNKVRIFSGSPTAFSIVARRYLLPIIREFVGDNRIDFEMAIGANAHGCDWDDIYKHVTRHGKERCFAGDYKNFDKQMPPELILGAFQIIRNICVAAGWEEDELKFIDGISYDTAFPTMDLFGTLIRCFGNNPSGHILTTPINSLVNSLYMRIACRRILIDNNYEVTLDDTGVNFTVFRNVMSLITYGDDNCGSTSSLYPCINHTSIQKALDEAGIIYTTDDKEAKSKGLVDVSTISFLKRKFVHSKELNRCIAPLLEDSIFKALTVWTMSKSITQQEQIAAVLDSMNREYFFYGREIFNDRHAFFLKLAIDKNVLQYLPDNKLLSYEELLFQCHNE